MESTTTTMIDVLSSENNLRKVGEVKACQYYEEFESQISSLSQINRRPFKIKYFAQGQELFIRNQRDYNAFRSKSANQIILDFDFSLKKMNLKRDDETFLKQISSQELRPLEEEKSIRQSSMKQMEKRETIVMRQTVAQKIKNTKRDDEILGVGLNRKTNSSKKSKILVQNDNEKQFIPDAIQRGNMRAFYRSVCQEAENYANQTYNQNYLKQDDLEFIESYLDLQPDDVEFRTFLKDIFHPLGPILSFVQAVPKSLVDFSIAIREDRILADAPVFFIRNILLTLQYEAQNRGNLPQSLVDKLEKYFEQQHTYPIISALSQKQYKFKDQHMIKLLEIFQKNLDQECGLALSQVALYQSLSNLTETDILDHLYKNMSFKIYLPIVFSALAKNGYNLKESDIDLLSIFLDFCQIQLGKLFQKPQKQIDLDRKGSNTSIFRITNEEIHHLWQIALKDDKVLTESDMIYLLNKMNEKGRGHRDRQLRIKIMNAFQKLVEKGCKLPDLVIQQHVNQLKDQDKKIALMSFCTLGTYLTNYHTQYENIQIEINNYLKNQKIQALYAIGYSSEKHKEKINQLNLTEIIQNITDTQNDKETKKAAIFALLKIQQVDSSQIQPEQFEEQILSQENTHVINLYIQWGIQRKKISITQKYKLSQLLNSHSHDIKVKVNASLALSYFSEIENVQGQFLTDMVFKNLLKAIQLNKNIETDENIDLVNNVLEIFGQLAKLEYQAFFNEDFLKVVTNCLEQQQFSLNSSFLVEQLAQKIDSVDFQQMRFIEVFIDQIAQLIEEYSIQDNDSLENISKSLAVFSNKKVLFKRQTLQRISASLYTYQNENIRNSLISALGYQAKNNNTKFDNIVLNNIIEGLTDSNEILREGCFIVLNNCIQNIPQVFGQEHIQSLADTIKNELSASLSCSLLKSMAKKKIKFDLTSVSKITGELTNINKESQRDISKLILHEAQNSCNFCEISLQNIENDIGIFSLDELEIIFKAVRIILEKKIQLKITFSTLTKITKVLNDRMANQFLRKESIKLLSQAFENGCSPNNQILILLINLINQDEKSIKKNAAKGLYNALKNHRQFCNNLKLEHVQLIEKNFNSISVIFYLIFSLYYIIQAGNHKVVMSETYDVLKNVYLNYGMDDVEQQEEVKSQKVRECSLKIMRIIEISQKTDGKFINFVKDCDLSLSVQEIAEKLIKIVKRDILIPIDYLNYIRTQIEAETYVNNKKEQENIFSLLYAVEIAGNMRQRVPNSFIESFQVLLDKRKFISDGLVKKSLSCILVLLKVNYKPSNIRDVCLAMSIECMESNNQTKDYLSKCLEIIQIFVDKGDQLPIKTIEYFKNYFLNLKEMNDTFKILMELTKCNFPNQELFSNVSNEFFKKQIESIEPRKQQSYENFSISREKSFEKLMNELKNENLDSMIVQKILNEFQIQALVNKINQFYEQQYIKMDENNIKQWIIEFKQKKKKQPHQEQLDKTRNDDLCHLLAIIKRTILIVRKYEPRLIQLITVLILYLNDSEKGFLAQISTGEGKTLTIAILAALKALDNLKVDIITSSAVLAQRDAKELKRFYSILGLVVMDNSDDKYKQYGPKQCYQQADVIYGDISNFQFDVLREEFSNLGTRNKRPFQFLIIDEVDNILIDETMKIAMLATSVPTMDSLIPLLYQIWIRMLDIDAKIFIIKNQMIFIQGENFRYVNDEIIFDTDEDMNRAQLEIIQNKEQFLRQELDQYAREILIPKMSISEHLKYYVNFQLSVWIENALIAYYQYEVNKHYVLEEKMYGDIKITPVDYVNTGIVYYQQIFITKVKQEFNNREF